MKTKLFLLTMMLAIPMGNIFAQNVFQKFAEDFKVLPRAKVGYNIKGTHDLRLIDWDASKKYVSDLGKTETAIGITFQWRQFGFLFDNVTYMEMGTTFFSPIQADYTFRLQYETKKIPVKIYFEHVCYHPVEGRNYKDIRGYSGGKTQIGISYGY